MFPMTMLPGQTPYTPAEAAQLCALIRDAARAAELFDGDALEIGPFRIERVTHEACPACGAESEVRIGRTVAIRGDDRRPGPRVAILDCPRCGERAVDPAAYDAPRLT